MKWEFRHHIAIREMREEELNKFGAEGWDLVCVHWPHPRSHYHTGGARYGYYFRRPLCLPAKKSFWKNIASKISFKQ